MPVEVTISDHIYTCVSLISLGLTVEALRVQHLSHFQHIICLHLPTVARRINIA